MGNKKNIENIIKKKSYRKGKEYKIKNTKSNRVVNVKLKNIKENNKTNKIISKIYEQNEEKCILCKNIKSKNTSCCRITNLKGLKEKLKFYDYYFSSTVRIVKKELGRYPYNFDNIDFKEGDIIIDIGGNVGMTSIYLIKKFPFLKIFSFEPVKTNYENFIKNLKINKVLENKVKAHNFGVTSDGRDIYMNFQKFNSGASRIIKYNKTINVTKKIMNKPIKSITLDQIFEKYNITKCKLLKVDCEGCEFEVLYNTKISNLEKCENLRMELHSNLKEKIKLIKYLNQYIKNIQYYPFFKIK